MAKLEVISADHPYTEIVAVMLKKLLAESEKGLVGKAIIFKNDGFLDLVEHPIEATGYSFSAAEVII